MSNDPFTATVKRTRKSEKRVHQDTERARSKLYRQVGEVVGQVLMEHKGVAVSISVQEAHSVDANDNLVISLTVMDVPHSASIQEALRIMDQGELYHRNIQMLEELVGEGD